MSISFVVFVPKIYGVQGALCFVLSYMLVNSRYIL
jgi:hypothetical protein